MTSLVAIYLSISLVFTYLNNKWMIHGNIIPRERYLRHFIVVLSGLLWPLVGWFTIYCSIKYRRQ